MIVGFVIGMIKLTAQVYAASLTGFLGWLANINFLFFAPSLFLLSVLILVIVSFATEAPSAEQLQGLTYSTVLAEDKAKSRASWGMTEVIHTLIIVGIIATILVYFSPLGVG